MSKKIVFAMHSTNLAGGVRAIFEISNGLVDKGYDVKIVALGGDHTWFKLRAPVIYLEPSSVVKALINLYRIIKFKKAKSTYLDIERFAKRFGFHVDLVSVLAESLAKLESDVVIATWYPTALSVWLAKVPKPFFFMQDFPELVEETMGFIGLRLFELTLHLPFHFLAVSTYTKDLILNYNENAKISITGAGVNLNVFYPRKNKAIDSKNKHVVMIILRDMKFKGGDIAIKALNLVNKKLPIHGIIISNKRTVDRIFRIVKPDFEYSIFSKPNDELLASLYSSSDVFLFTSYKEGFGLPPLEAMATGTAVVTTNCGGVNDYAVNDYNALIVPPGDLQTIAESVLKILNNNKLKDKLIQGGLETAKNWTWNKVVNKIEEATRSDN